MEWPLVIKNEIIKSFFIISQALGIIFELFLWFHIPGATDYFFLSTTNFAMNDATYMLTKEEKEAIINAAKPQSNEGINRRVEAVLVRGSFLSIKPPFFSGWASATNNRALGTRC